MARKISAAEVAKHNQQGDCWVIIHGKVYDLTNFLPDHPGGVKVITRWAGHDATEAFDPIHPPDIIERYLSPDVCLGEIDTPFLGQEYLRKKSEIIMAERRKAIPPLGEMLNLFDFEEIAKKVLSPEAWAYYSSGADDEITLRENHNAFHRIWFRPRILINVRDVDLSCQILGYTSTLPVYITATALAKLGHPDGEVVLTKAAHQTGLIQMLPTLASCSLDQMTDARQPGQTQFFQLYVNQDRSATEKLIRQAEKKGCKALFVTVDAPQLGRREKDMRMKYSEAPPDIQSESTVDRSQGAARAISSFLDPGFCWEDLKWIREITSMPLILKGVQCGEDAVLAVQHGVQGIVISNHGGRQLDFARSGIEVLPEVMSALRAHNYQNRLEVYVDGGIRRGSDIFKAIALGAKAVGVGRPFLYAMSTYGVEGVVRAIQLLRGELEMTMRLCGCRSISDIREEMIDWSGLRARSSVADDCLGRHVYERLRVPGESKL
ncbi:uncharacterized protein VTP21DRAFT_4993 [Calcarisporiella thermophila]|uniref:uncharacterized protein n=1 Tax=Calcarisporiella thermophila TaxID=911321 RepID=UPI0037430B0C